MAFKFSQKLNACFCISLPTLRRTNFLNKNKHLRRNGAVITHHYLPLQALRLKVTAVCGPTPRGCSGYGNPGLRSTIAGSPPCRHSEGRRFDGGVLRGLGGLRVGPVPIRPFGPALIRCADTVQRRARLPNCSGPPSASSARGSPMLSKRQYAGRWSLCDGRGSTPTASTRVLRSGNVPRCLCFAASLVSRRGCRRGSM